MPQFGFIENHSHNHAEGAHGSLHKIDSLVPLIIRVVMKNSNTIDS